LNFWAQEIFEFKKPQPVLRLLHRSPILNNLAGGVQAHFCSMGAQPFGREGLSLEPTAADVPE
jgi:hypothetical protein